MDKFYNSLAKRVAAEADAATSGSIKINGSLYLLNYKRDFDHYEITCNGEFVINLRGRKLSKAKKDFSEWLKN